VPLRIVIDKDLCCAHGLCVEIAPSLFVLGDDEKAHVLGVPGDEDLSDAQAAQRACPQMAIVVENAGY
jgi:ferredoxin